MLTAVQLPLCKLLRPSNAFSRVRWLLDRRHSRAMTTEDADGGVESFQFIGAAASCTTGITCCAPFDRPATLSFFLHLWTRKCLCPPRRGCMMYDVYCDAPGVFQ